MRTLLALNLIATLSLVAAATVVLVPTASAECTGIVCVGCTGDTCVVTCTAAGACVIAGSEGRDCSSAVFNYAAIYQYDPSGFVTGVVGAYAFTHCQADPSYDSRIAASVYSCDWSGYCDHVSWGWAHDGSGCHSRVDIVFIGLDAVVNLPLCQVSSPPPVPRILP